MTPNMKARIGQLCKTEAEWNLLPKVVPFKGELVLYAPDRNHPYVRMKVGDGKTLLKELPFTINDVIDGGRIK